MAAYWDTFGPGARGTAMGQREWGPGCKEANGMYQGLDARPSVASYRPLFALWGAYGNPVRARQVWHEQEGMARYVNNDGYISHDVRIFNMFQPAPMHRRAEYIDPTYVSKMQSGRDYATSIVASGIAGLNGGGIG